MRGAQEKGFQTVKNLDTQTPATAGARKSDPKSATAANTAAKTAAHEFSTKVAGSRRRGFWSAVRQATGLLVVGPAVASALIVSASYLSQTSPVDMLAKVVQRVALGPSCARFADALGPISQTDRTLCVTSPIVHLFMARESAIVEYDRRNTMLEQHYVAVIDGLQNGQGVLRVGAGAGTGRGWDFDGESPRLLDPGIEVWSVNGSMRIDVSGLDPRDGQRRTLTYAASKRDAERALALSALCRKGGCERYGEASRGALRAILIFPKSPDETIGQIMREHIEWQQKTMDLMAAIKGARPL